MKELLRRLTHFVGRGRFDSELDDEIRFHLETRAAELQQAGLAAREALEQARREFGPAARVREDTRSAWRFQWIEDLFADLRYAARALGRSPAFALTAIACLTLGIGANTTMFSVATEVLFSMPSARDPQTLLHITIGGDSHAPMTHLRFLRDAKVFESLAGEHEEDEVNWRVGDATYRLAVVHATDNFFDTLGIPVAMGRGIQTGDTDTVVLSHGFWQRRLGADPQVLGRMLILDGKPHTVVGVLPHDHRSVIGFGFSPEMYIPVTTQPFVAFYARVAPGTTAGDALGRLQSACRELDRVLPDKDHKWAEEVRVTAAAGIDRLRAEGQLLPMVAFFAMLMIVVGLVLLIACGNVASLLLARASSRSHELAIRLSIGAGRGRLIRQLLAESLLLAVCGSLGGLLLNYWLTTSLSRIRLPLPVPVQFVIEPDWRLLLYAITVGVACTLAAGLMPAIKGTRAGLNIALKQDEHQVGRGGWTLRGALVAGQIAVSVVLLSAAFVFLRNLAQSATLAPGFDVDHAVWASMRLVPDASKRDRVAALAQSGLESLRVLPGIESAAVAARVPLNSQRRFSTGIRVDGRAGSVRALFHGNDVTPEYFKTMGIPILGGRDFLSSDRKGAAPVAILNENLARHLFGNIDPMGHTIQFEGPALTVVGVARNSKYFTLGEESAMALYSPYAQSTPDGEELEFLLRSASPTAAVKGITAALLNLDPTAGVETKPMRNALTFAMLPSRVGAVVLGAMGFLGLALASIGLYGVLLFAVSRRIREIGLRMALGATPGRILRTVVGESAALVACGLGIGIALAVLAVRPLAMFLIPEVRPNDPATFLTVAGVFAMVALVATLAPAMRALRVDPVVALRHE